MKDFILRLTSRKFLVTIAGIVAVTLYPAHAQDIITLIITFVGAEGAADVVGRYSTEKTKQSNLSVRSDAINAGLIQPDAVDTSSVVPGVAADIHTSM